MTPSNDLFRLIKSLSSTEKAYFKKFSHFTKYKSRENIYLNLFVAINKQKEYNEEKLKQKFKSEPFMKQLPVAKNYLYGRILDSLELYHSEMNQRVIVRNTLNKAEILRKKGLYDQALKVVRKTKEIAKENEMHISLLDMSVHIELGLALEKYDMELVQIVNKEIADNLSLLKNDAILHDLNFKIAVYYHKYLSSRNPVFLKQAKQVIKSKYLSDSSYAKTFFGKNRFYESHAFYALATGDTKNVYNLTKKMVANFDSAAGMVERNFLSYISVLNNFINVCAEIKKYDEGILCLEKLISKPNLINAQSIRSRIFYVYNYLFLFLNNSSGFFDNSGKRLAGIIEEMKEFENEMNDSEKAMLYVNMSASYFGLKDIKSCIRWLNKVRNDLDMQNHPELDCFVRVFYLVAHFESHNNELIPHLVKSGDRFFSKKEKKYEIEILFIDFFKYKILKVKNPNETIEKFKTLRKKFIPLSEHPQERSYFKYFDFLKWIDDKIKGEVVLLAK